MRALRTLALVAGSTAGLLLPLYGDSQPSSVVSHAEWARMLLRGLELLSDAPGVNDTAAQAFATLSGRDSRTFPAGDYVRARYVELVSEGRFPQLRPAGGIGEAAYAVAVARGGEYRLRLQVAGTAHAEAEMTRAGDNAVFHRFSIPASPAMAWRDAGSVHLDPGAYDATVLLPEGCSLERLEVAPPCVHPIEPRGGWQLSAVATVDDVAVTTLQALDLESELPPSGPPLEYRGSDLRLEDGTAPPSASVGGFHSGLRGAQVFLRVEIPEDGLYTVSVFGVRSGGQRWVTDGCRVSILCPSIDPTPRWYVLLSGRFQKGQHLFAVALGPETFIERIRVEPKKDTPADYVATLERLGLTLGPPGPITREKAEEARRFLVRLRAQLYVELCGDILRPGTLVAELTGTGPLSSGGGAGPGGPFGPGDGGPRDGNGGGPPPPPDIPQLPPPSPTLPVGFGD